MEYGLSERAALAAVTTTPASLLGIPNLVVLGTGMAANFVVADGHLFGEDTSIRFTFVDGELEEGRTAPAAGARTFRASSMRTAA